MQSKQLPFDKIHACGNDFLLLMQPPPDDQVAPMCDRRHGIGADGIMVLEGIEGERVRLQHLDPDGSRSFCLNGTRSALACLAHKGLLGGARQAHCEGTDLTFTTGETTRVVLPKAGYEARTWCGAGLEVRGFFADVGNPQFVIIEAMDCDDFRSLAPSIRADRSVFPNGTNVNQVYRRGDGWAIHTFERGVEDFTLSCGSGMLAAAAVLLGECDPGPIHFQPDGKGRVRVDDLGDRLALEGPTGWPASGVWLCG